jgi:hypothetical protein
MKGNCVKRVDINGIALIGSWCGALTPKGEIETQILLPVNPY